LETKKTRNDPLLSLHTRSESGIITRFILLPVVLFFQLINLPGLPRLRNNLGRRRSRMGIQIYDSSLLSPNTFYHHMRKYMSFDGEFLNCVTGGLTVTIRLMKTSTIKTVIVTCFLCLLIGQTGLGQEFVWDPMETPPGINTEFDEFNLHRFGKDLIFTRVVHGTPKQFVLNADGSVESFTWPQESLKSIPMVYPHWHDSNTILFATPYRNNTQMNLIIQMLKDGINIQEVDSTLRNYYSSQPFMSPNGKELFIVSNKKGGFGGTDIWLYDKEDAGWTRGNDVLHEIINTSSDEKTPYLPHPDTLYFSTNSDGGKGGFDILRIIRENGTWNSPEPVYELNSKWDDTDFMIFEWHGETLAAISSTRPSGKGKSDIFWFRKKMITEQRSSQLFLSTENISEITQNIFNKENALAFRTCINTNPEAFHDKDESMIITLGKRLAETPGGNIRLSNHPMTSTIVSLLKQHGARDSQIFLDKNSTKSCVMMSTSTSPALFAPITDTEITCIPKSFRINVSGAPENAFNSWEVLVNGSTLESGNQLPAEVEYKTFKYLVKPQQALYIVAKGIDTNGIRIQESTTITINQSIQNQAGSSYTGSAPTIWNFNEYEEAKSFLIEFLNAHANTQRTAKLFISEFNEAIVNSTIESLKKDFPDWSFIKSPLGNDSYIAPLIRLSLSKYPREERLFLIPCLVQ
ncbi:MAG: hypothetical protein ACKOFB_05545, partial [bacterium]